MTTLHRRGVKGGILYRAIILGVSCRIRVLSGIVFGIGGASEGILSIISMYKRP